MDETARVAASLTAGDARRTPRSLLAYTHRHDRGTAGQTVRLTRDAAPTRPTRLRHRTDGDQFVGIAGLACDVDELASAYVVMVPMSNLTRPSRAVRGMSSRERSGER